MVVEKVMVVVFDTSKMAVPVGTAAGVQLVPVSKSPDPGLRSQLAFCAWAPEMVTSSNNKPPRSIRAAKWQARARVRIPMASAIIPKR